MSTLRTQRVGRTALAMDEYLTIHDLRQALRLGRSAAYALTHSPGFPAPAQLSGSSYRWPRPAVEAFLASKTIPSTQQRSATARAEAPARRGFAGRTRARSRRSAAAE